MVIVTGDPYKDPISKPKPKLDSYYIKASLLHYFRFNNQYHHVATECGIDEYTMADVLCYTGDKVIEVEVKTSKSDLRGDKKNKATKHSSRKKELLHFGNGKPIEETTRATHFYFCVPEELVEAALEEVSIINPKYGVMVCYASPDLYGQEFGKNVNIVKRAEALHSLPLIKDRIKEKIAARNASELASMYKNFYVDRYKKGC